MMARFGLDTCPEHSRIIIIGFNQKNTDEEAKGWWY
jgi:hypothetical protein